MHGAAAVDHHGRLLAATLRTLPNILIASEAIPLREGSLLARCPAAALREI
jgi:hypothetical protein